MTRHEHSESQNIAEAAAPTRSLEDTIALHRALADMELHGIMRLHQRDGDDQGIGVPFSHPFERFLDGSYGAIFPWRAGLKAVRIDCRRSHSEHWACPDGGSWYGSLCAELVSLTCSPGNPSPFDRACYILHVSPERTERTLLRAFRRIEQRLDEIQSRETEVVQSDSGRNDWQSPAHVHRALDGLHAQECAQCLRAGVA